MSGQEAGERQPGTLVISRSVGEGFSIGEDWRFEVAEVNARFVTLTITSGNREWSCRLEADESLHITGRNTLRRSAAGAQRRGKALVGVRVARVTSNDVRLAVCAPRSLKIHRHEHRPQAEVAEA